MAANETDTPVIVVGAGPVGMSAALSLRARGLPVTVLEADPEDRERPGSRAIYVHGSTLRTWENVKPGLGQDLADAGLVWPTRRTLWRGKEVFSRTYSHSSGGLPHFTSLPQVETEDFLLEACREEDVDIHWESAVVEVETEPDGVELLTEDGSLWTADYVIAADGARSAVRGEIDAEFEGSRSENSFVIVDVMEDPDDPRPPERVFHYEHPEMDGRNVLLVPFSGGWRVDLQCRTSDDPEWFARDDVVRDWVGTVLGENYVDRIDWVSDYQFLQVVADSFVDEHRRGMLAGEAAHLFAPFGARGMNSGVPDADEAASAVAVATHARQDAVARMEVENYAARREFAADWNREAAGQALQMLEGASPLVRAQRFVAAQLADFWEPAGEWLDDAPYGPKSGPPLPTESKY